MNKLILLFLILPLPTIGQAPSGYGCGYNTNLKIAVAEFRNPNQRVIDEIKEIVAYSGLPANFEIFSANIKNAAAVMISSKRYIIYDRELLASSDKGSNGYWASMSILAHEVAHHLSGHTLQNNYSSYSSELDADRFSGFILYKMGASEDQSLLAINQLGSPGGTATHPPKAQRIGKIKEGWKSAASLRYKGATPPAPDNDKPSDYYEFTKEMLINREYLKLDPGFYKNPKYLYGVITEVDKDFGAFTLRVIKGGNNYINIGQSLNGTDFKIYFDEVHFGANSDMCHACEANFKALMVPGRRLKVSMVEGCPHCGTAYNGVWSLSYAHEMKVGSF